MPFNRWRSEVWNSVKSRLGLHGPLGDDPDFHKGVLALEDKDYDLAIACFGAVLRRFPNDPIPYHNRGNAHFQKRDYDKAAADYTRAIEVSPTFAPAYYARGSVALLKGDADQAVADCSDAIRLAPDDAIAYVHRANAYSVKKDFERALTDYGHALRLKPTEAKAAAPEPASAAKPALNPAKLQVNIVKPEETKKAMQKILDDIRSGEYAKGWIKENETGRPWFARKRAEEQHILIEKVGEKLRAMMPFLKPVKIQTEEPVSK